MQLCINSWGEGIRELTGRPAAAAMGKKYYEVFPRIHTDRGDAIKIALKNNKRLELKGYTINCLCDQMRVDITIDPMGVPEGGKGGARVDIAPSATCSTLSRLQHAQKFIDIGKMASTLAHGVRSPLNAIKGAVIYLREKYADESTLIEFTKIMEDEITRLDNFISKFLSTSISDSEFAETDINSLLRRAEISTSMQANANGLKTSYKYGKVPLVRVNSFQLEHAMLNVINNAIEAMPSGGRLMVKTKTRKRPEGDYAVIEVSDTGPGISGARIDEEMTQKNRKGRGFGLFLTREVLQYYGGYLEIKSEKDVGTTVSLCLPLDRRSA